MIYVDFTELYAPVINDVSWRVLLILKMLKKYHAMIVDVETAFLYGDLDEEVYMICKEVHEDDDAAAKERGGARGVEPSRSLPTFLHSPPDSKILASR